MSAATIRRKVLADLAEAHLKTLTGVAVYRGEITASTDTVHHPPVLTAPGGAPDPSGRVAPYAVLYTGAGTRGLDHDVADAHDDLDWSFQVTCAAGYETDCGYLIDRVDGLFYRWAPTVPGLAFGRAKPPLGYDPGPIRRDETVTPVRFWVPLQYRLPATT